MSKLLRSIAIRFVIVLAVATAAFQPALADTPKTLAFGDLINHPERWPATTRLSIKLMVDNDTLNPGVEMPIYDINLTGVELIAPKGYTIVVEEWETSILADANKYWAKLTSEQQALTLDKIERDRTLWPSKVKINETMDFGNLKIEADSILPLTLVRAGEVAVTHPDTNNMLFVPAKFTDLFTRARALAALPAEQRPGLLADLLEGIPVDAQGKPTTLNKNARYYVIYFTASTCPHCEVFTPKIVEHVKRTLAKRADVVLLTWPTEATTAPMLAYVKRKNIPWPTIPAEIKGQIGSLINQRGVFEIPGILVVDRFNTPLLSTSNMSGQPLDAANAALTQLESVLK